MIPISTPAIAPVKKPSPTGSEEDVSTRLHERLIGALDFAFVKGAERAVQANALRVFMIRVASAALLFLSQIALARWMGASDYGIFVSLWTAVLVVGGISHLGLNVAMMRLVPEYLASGSFESVRGLLFGGRLLAVASGAALAIIGAAIVWLARASIEPALVLPLLLALACLPVYALTDVQDAIGRGQGWALEGVVPPYLVRPLLILLFIGVAFFLSVTPDAATGMACALLATAAAAAVQTWLIGRRVRECVPRGPRQIDFPAWLKISLPLLAVGASELVLQNADILILNLFRSPGEIGVYYAAVKTTCLALFVHYAVGSAYAGRISAARALADEAEVHRLAREAVRWTFYPSLAVTIAVLAIGYPLLSQFGPSFTSAYPLMFILAIGVMARAAAGPSEFVLNMLAEERTCARSFTTAAAVSIGLNLLLIPLWGVTGAAIATASAFSTAAFLNWRAARRRIGLDLFVFAGAESAASARTLFEEYQEIIERRRTVGIAPPVVTSGPDDLKLEIVRDAQSFAALEHEWNELFARAATSAQLFQRFDWNQAWVRHYLPAAGPGAGPRLAVVVGRRAGKVEVIWPLVTWRTAGMTHLGWMGDPVSQYGDVLVAGGDGAIDTLRASWRFLTDAIAPDIVRLRRVRADAAVVPLLSELDAWVSQRVEAPFIDLSGAKDLATFEERYTPKARRNRRRLLRRLEEKGKVAFIHAAKGEQARELVAKSIELKRLWLSDRGLFSTALRDERIEGFFTSVTDGDASCCRLSALTLDGVACAIMIFVSSEKRLAGHIFAYDLNRHKDGVGVLLLEDCIRWAIANHYEVFDFMAPADAYKLDWTDSTVPVADWALPLTISGRAFARLYLGFAREHLKRTLEATPVELRKMVLEAYYSGPGAP